MSKCLETGDHCGDCAMWAHGWCHCQGWMRDAEDEICGPVPKRDVAAEESEYIKFRMGEKVEPPTTEWHKGSDVPRKELEGLAVVGSWDGDGIIMPDLVFWNGLAWYRNRNCKRVPAPAMEAVTAINDWNRALA